MASVAECMRDGYSTAGTSGAGLGAVGRQAETVDIYTARDQGTVLLARLWAQKPVPSQVKTAALGLGAVCVPAPHETMGGDAWAVTRSGDQFGVILADGLGHGPSAAEASNEAVRVFLDASGSASGLLPPSELLGRIHDALRKTRGAAVAVAILDAARRQLTFAGVGNLSAAILPPPGSPKVSEESQSMVSHNGTVGAEMRKVQQFVYPWPRGSNVVFHSDGLASHWRLENYPGLAGRHPALIAGVLYRDFQRVRDDVTVLVVRDAN
jgi:hypothetical protein